jgi:hypothetical protein
VNAADVVAALAADGVELALRTGRLCLRPSGRARPVLVALIRQHAVELRALLAPAGEGSQSKAAGEPRDDAPGEDAEERAAIMEYDGGLPRAEAERLAAGVTRQVGHPKVDPEVLPRGPRSFEDWGDLRPCLLCRNLARRGRCLAAWRRELRAAADYRPTFPQQPQRCVGYVPKAEDPDQTTGRQRWPDLVDLQTRTIGGPAG